jgi:hypothetical protein
MAAGLLPAGQMDPNGTVTAENPAANTPVPKGTPVQLTTQSSGANQGLGGPGSGPGAGGGAPKGPGG